MKFKEVELKDKGLFSINIGKRITKKELHNKSKGAFPVYSANIYSPFGWVDSLLIKIFSGDFVIWGIDGDWMTRYIPENTCFVPTDHCGYLQCFDSNIDLQYLSYLLKNIGDSLGFSRSYRASIENIGNISVQVPIKPDGGFDLEAQKKIAKRYERIEKFQNLMKDYLKTIKSCVVTIEQNKDVPFKSFDLKQIGQFIKGNSQYTARYCFENRGELPVYSAKTKGNKTIGYINTYDFEVECLKITTNGFYAGTVDYLNKQKFSINGDTGIFILNEEYKNQISYQYLTFILRNIREVYGFGWENKPLKEDIENLLIDIPIKPDGAFDLEEQQKIAKGYQNIEFKRAQAMDMLKRITEAQVRVDF